MRPVLSTAMPATRIVALFAILLLLWAGAGAVLAQDRQTGTMTIAVQPAGPAGTPGAPAGWSGSPPPAGAPGESPRTTAPTRIATPARIGTVSAAIAVAPMPPANLPDATSWTRLAVRDDRGTASGWTVLWHGDHAAAAWPPFLLVNRADSIVRVLPVTAPALDPGVRPGRILGAHPGPVLLLRAQPASGQGVFHQDLIAIFPKPPGPLAFIVIHLTAAP